MTNLGFKVTIEMLTEDDQLEDVVKKYLEGWKERMEIDLEYALGDYAGLNHLAWSVEDV